MNINNSITQYNNFASSSNVGTNMSTQNLTGNTVSSLKEGQVFEGSINSIDSNGKVVIGLANGQTMNARLDSGVSITQGKSLFFQVKSNDGLLVQIRPVSIDINSNPTLLKALDSANIMATEKSIAMVNAMMERSMPIDSESLAAMNRLLINNPSIDIETVALMNKFGIAVNDSNAGMFENYIKNEAALMKDVSVIGKNISEILSTDTMQISEKIDLYRNLNDIFLSQTEDRNLTIMSSNNLKDVSMTNTDSLFNENGLNQSNNNVSLNEENSVIAENNLIENDKTILDDIQNEKAGFVQAKTDGSEAQALSYLSKDGLLELNKIIGASEDFRNTIKDFVDKDGFLKSNLSAKDLFFSISNFISSETTDKNIINSIFKNAGFKELFNKVFNDAFSLDPKEVTEPRILAKAYEKMLNAANEIEQLIHNASGKNVDNIKHAITQLKDNISFMNSSNELYSFVQIPLKMFNQNTESTLYVRQNKHDSYKAGEELTAFLHFDMQHLGSTDVYIRLKEKNVACNWTLENEKSLDLIEQNLDILYERLANKGFSCNMEVSCKKEEMDILCDFFGEKQPSENLLHRYSFDMRA